MHTQRNTTIIRKLAGAPCGTLVLFAALALAHGGFDHVTGHHRQSERQRRNGQDGQGQRRREARRQNRNYQRR